MNKAKIIIDSFKQTNTVLINEKVVAENSEIMNYFSRPILTVADKILDAIESEFNDEFETEVFGNAFEQAYVSLLCKNHNFCTKYTTNNSEICIPTAQRITFANKYKKVSGMAGFRLLTNLDNIDISAYEGVNYSEDDTHIILVTDDVDFLHLNLTNAVKIAFFVSGESQIIGKNIVIGCTEDNLNDLVNAYIDTVFINPIINSSMKGIVDVSDESILANRITPYYNFTDKLSLEIDESTEIVVNAIPSSADKSKLTFAANNQNVEIESRMLTGKSVGTSEITVYGESPFPLGSISVNVYHDVFVESIKITVDAIGDFLCEGKEYDIDLEIIPEDAKDAALVTVESLNPDVAEVVDNKLVVKSAGTFSLSAKSENASCISEYESKAKINGITVIGMPEEAFIGDTYPISVTIEPEEVYKSGCKWTSTDKKKAIVGIDSNDNLVLKAIGVGEVTVKCISIDDSNVYYERKLKVKSSFTRQKNPQIAFYIALIATLLALVTAFFGIKSKLVFFFALIAIIASVASMLIEKYTKKKGMFCLILSSIALVIHMIVTLIYNIG